MEDVSIAFRSARFAIDLDDALTVLKDCYSRKAHVVARLQNAALFELGRDYVLLKPPLSKHKYYLTAQCLQRLSSQRGVVARPSVGAKRKISSEQHAGVGNLEEWEFKLEKKIATLSDKLSDCGSEQLQSVLATLKEIKEEQRAVRTLLDQPKKGPRSIIESTVNCGYWKGGGWGR